MAVQYNAAWNLLIGRETQDSPSTQMASVLASTIAKFNHDNYVGLEIFKQIFRIPHFDFADIAGIPKEVEQ